MPPEIFHAEVAGLAALPAWMIDGNYIDTIAPRYERADTIIDLDLPGWLILCRVIRRTVANDGRVPPAGPAGCRERFNLAFLRYV